ncbi:hypothetical protein [Erythrobacter sp. MTPC3]|uniref:hypothetical protein n=1 Tax=Erythrobacter sp. MTPC3 TaxID=3056564 RepID=UPI0036F34C60
MIGSAIAGKAKTAPANANIAESFLIIMPVTPVPSSKRFTNMRASAVPNGVLLLAQWLTPFRPKLKCKEIRQLEFNRSSGAFNRIKFIAKESTTAMRQSICHFLKKMRIAHLQFDLF